MSLNCYKQNKGSDAYFMTFMDNNSMKTKERNDYNFKS